MEKKTALLLLANGSDEIEVVVTADILRRGGIDVTIASLSGANCVKCCYDVMICADAKLADAIKNKKYDVVVLPGGTAGTKALAASTLVGKLLRKQAEEEKLIAAIGTSIIVLKIHNIGKPSCVACHPCLRKDLVEYQYSRLTEIKAGYLLTSKGGSTAYGFGLAIVYTLQGIKTTGRVAREMLCDVGGISDF